MYSPKFWTGLQWQQPRAAAAGSLWSAVRIWLNSWAVWQTSEPGWQGLCSEQLVWSHCSLTRFLDETTLVMRNRLVSVPIVQLFSHYRTIEICSYFSRLGAVVQTFFNYVPHNTFILFNLCLYWGPRLWGLLQNFWNYSFVMLFWLKKPIQIFIF